MSASWVTTTMVTPCSRLSETSVSMISCEVLRIEIAGRFVGEQQARLVDQRPCDGHALLLAAGKLARRVALAIAQPEDLKCRAGPLEANGATDRAGGRVVERQADILQRARARQQIEALEHEAEALAADARQFGFVQRGDIDALEQAASAGRPVEAADDGHQRRLARTRRADDGDELAGFDFEVDAAQRLHLDIAHREGACHMFELDDRLRHRVLPPRPQKRGDGNAGPPVCPLSSPTMTGVAGLRSPWTIFGEVLVVEADGNGEPTPADRRAAPRGGTSATLAAPVAPLARAAGHVAQRLVGHADDVLPLVDDDPRRGGHARLQHQVARCRRSRRHRRSPRSGPFAATGGPGSPCPGKHAGERRRR